MQNAFKIILETSIYSSIMIAFVLLVKSFLAGKLSTRIMSLLWIAVLIRLAMPITLESPVHFIALDPPTPSAIEDTINEDVIITDNASAEYIDNYNYAPTDNRKTQSTAPTSDIQKVSFFQKAKSFIAGISLWTVAFLMWVIGAVFVFAKSTIRNLAFRKKIIRTQTVTTVLEEKLINAKATLDVRGNIRICESNCVNIPLVHGALNPIVIVPVGFSQSIKRSKLKLIIMHELCHIKRGDIFINFCWLAVKSLHWFNPLVQIAYKSYLINIEEACDEMMLHYLTNSDKFDYPQSLLDVMRLTKIRHSIPSALSLCSSDSSIKKRVVKMVKPIKKSKSTSIVTLLVSLVMVFVCFTTACQPKVATINSTNNITENSQTDEGKLTIEKLDLFNCEYIYYLKYDDYFGDKILHYGSHNTNEDASFKILESDLSLIQFINQGLDLRMPIELSEEDLEEIALSYVKKTWNSNNIQITSTEIKTYKRDDRTDSSFVLDGTMGKNERPFSVRLNGQGELAGMGSYPNDIDLSKGLSSVQAQQKAVELLKEEAHLINSSNLTLINEEISTEYSLPYYIFEYEYRSDNPTIEEFDYDSTVEIFASTGERMSLSATPITSNIDCVQLAEAEQTAKESIAEKYYGSKDMTDRLTTINSWTMIDFNMFEYRFEFEYAPKESSDITDLCSYALSVYPTGELAPDISVWKIEN